MVEDWTHGYVISSPAFSTKAMLPTRGIETDDADVRFDQLSKEQLHTNSETHHPKEYHKKRAHNWFSPDALLHTCQSSIKA